MKVQKKNKNDLPPLSNDDFIPRDVSSSTSESLRLAF